MVSSVDVRCPKVYIPCMKPTRRGFLKSLAAATAASPLGGLLAAPSADVPVPRRKFGRHKEEVSVIGLGGQTLGQAASLDEAISIAHRAIDQGITFFDNAWDYHGGRAEEWMGAALDGGWRDKVFLMTKVCTHGKPLPAGGKEGAMKMLEESLRRLKTDHLDLWMVHQLENDEEVAKAYGPGGVIESLELAKKQGKVRYTGFTGHTDPEAHVRMVEGGYPFDASLMPVSVLGALSSRRFEEVVMPVLAAKDIAVIGMKGFGGSRRAHLHGFVTAESVVRYSLSYPEVCTHLIGIDRMEYVDAAVAASQLPPMDAAERSRFLADVAARGGERFANYLAPGYRDGAA
ncbi:MAG: aldo/keto reductase [Terrimicrobiaceae bacterium]